jgi:nitric oxide synthase oxygenase domain/subunit
MMRDWQVGIDRSKVDDLSKKAQEIILAGRRPESVARNGVLAGLSFHVCYSESEENFGVMKHVRITYKQERVFEWEEKKTCFYTPGVWEREFAALHSQLVGSGGRSRVDIRREALPHPSARASKIGS